MPNSFYQKKQLLAQRDDILEDIGLTIFMGGDLPGEFRNLPREFSSMEILVNQLRDRYRVLKEERDRVHLDYSEFVNQLAKIESEFRKKIAPLEHDRDELSLKIQVAKDQAADAPKRGRQNQEVASWETQAGELGGRIAQLEKKRNEEIEAVKEQTDPLDLRLQKLDQGIRKIQEEEEHLSFAGKKRLQDLGYNFYHARRDEFFYGDKYTKLDELREDLSHSVRQSTSDYEFNGEAPVKRRNYAYMLLILAVLFGVYLFRTQYHQAQVPLAGLAAEFLAADKGYRLYADMEKVPRYLHEHAPSLVDLPGGEVFRDLSREDLQEFVIARDEQDRLLFCGLQFVRPPTRFGTRMAQLGWEYAPTAKGWLAMTDGEWVWLGLNDRGFLVLPVDHLARFEEQAFSSNADWFRLQARFEPYDSNATLLQGYGRFDLVFREDRFQIDLRAVDRLLDSDARQRRIQLLEEHQEGPPLQFSMSEDSLRVVGPRSLFPVRLFQEPTKLRDFLAEMIGDWEASVAKSKLLDIAPSEATHPVYPQGHQWIRVFSRNRLGLVLLDEFRIGGSVSGLAFRERSGSLLVADEGARLIREFRFDGHHLTHTRSRDLSRHPLLEKPFNPSALKIDPSGRFAIALEHLPADPKTPRMVLLDLDDLNLVTVEKMPTNVRNGLCSVWDTEGSTLFVGVTGLPRRDGSALGVLAYRRQGEVLNLLRFIDVPVSDRKWIQITALAYRESHNTLLMRREPSDELVRYRVDRAIGANTQWLSLSENGDPKRRILDLWSRGTLQLNRNQDLAVIATFPSQAKTDLFLVDLGEGEMTVLDRTEVAMDLRSILPVPMTDRFWFSAPKSRLIGALDVGGRGILVETVQAFEDFQPTLMASDPWGDYLFVVGSMEP